MGPARLSNFAAMCAFSAAAACCTAPTPPEAGGAPSQFVTVEDRRIHYVEHGSGPAVVMLHGASTNLRDLEVALLPAAAEGRRVILMDRPGLGLSTRPPGAHDPREQARLLHLAIKAIGVERPVLLAHSFAGSVALAYALAYPEDLAGLLLIAPVSHPWPGGVAWYNHAAASPVTGPLFRRTVIPALGPRLAKAQLGDGFPDDYYDRAQVNLLFRPTVFKANAEDLVNLKPLVRDMSSRYGEIKTPTVLIADPDDTVVWTKIHAVPLSEQIEGASLTLLPGAGHAIPHIRPDVILEALDDLMTQEVTPSP